MVWSLAGLLAFLPVVHQAFAGVRFCAQADGAVRIERLHTGDDAARPCAGRDGRTRAAAHDGQAERQEALHAAAGAGLFQAVCTHVCFDEAAADHHTLRQAPAPDAQPAFFGPSLHLPSEQAHALLYRPAASPPPVSSLFAPLRSIVLLI